MIKGTKYVQMQRRGAWQQLTNIWKVQWLLEDTDILSVSQQVYLGKQILFRKKNHNFVHL